MNTFLVTTGIQPLCIGSIETFQTSAFLSGLPWDITGGSATLHFTDPAGGTLSLPANITGGGAQVQWTVIAPEGDWVRAWDLQDALGRRQVSQPIAFRVIPSPS